jgi:chorismate mutase/prephenate dehydratase
VFFIDFEGHIEDQAVANVLDELNSQVVELKVLGSYPCAVL